MLLNWHKKNTEKKYTVFIKSFCILAKLPKMKKINQSCKFLFQYFFRNLSLFYTKLKETISIIVVKCPLKIEKFCKKEFFRILFCSYSRILEKYLFPLSRQCSKIFVTSAFSSVIRILYISIHRINKKTMYYFFELGIIIGIFRKLISLCLSFKNQRYMVFPFFLILSFLP